MKYIKVIRRILKNTNKNFLGVFPLIIKNYKNNLKNVCKRN